MGVNTYPTAEDYIKYIAAYHKEIHAYEIYAKALKRVLERACKVSIPEAIVQARHKDVSSFAGKWVRKYDKYPDPIADMTDLCGARVIAQTLEQVIAICHFIEYNFVIVEKDDKGLSLGESNFGYRDMHFLIQLKYGNDRAGKIGFDDGEQKAIGNRIAELQVRTWVQHAWADTLHDRIYKTPLQLSTETKREGALLAAIMEDGDRAFNRLALELDGMEANYTAYAARDDVKREIKAQELIFKHEPADSSKIAVLALRLSRLIAPGGDYGGVVSLLDRFKDIQGPIRPELLLELGYALCKTHRNNPESEEYTRGQLYLKEGISTLTSPDLDAVPNLRKQRSLLALANFRYAWSWEAHVGGEVLALEHYRRALELEPENPYYLIAQLGYEIYCHRSLVLIQAMRASIEKAIASCKSHALSGTELPYAYFTAGRLSLLLEENSDSKGGTPIEWYSRGLCHRFSGTSYAPPDLLDEEMGWLRRISFGKQPSKHQNSIRDLIIIAQNCQNKCAERANAKPNETSSPDKKVLIIAGGAASMSDKELQHIRPLIKAALQDFQGTVISGGTISGVPGCVGEVTAQLQEEKCKCFKLIGFLPEHTPNDAPPDRRYDHLFEVGKDSFSAEQILENWQYVIREEIEPNQVLLLGFGGGSISAIEYSIALACGARVALIISSGREADRIINDPVWKGVKNLCPLPSDPASIRAIVLPVTQQYEELDSMARAFHENYVAMSSNRLPANMQPWENLDETYKKANAEQAKYSVDILRAAGFEVRTKKEPVLITFSDEIECMAALEHGRWNIERLQDGWLPGKKRDNSKKIHNCLVPWNELSEEIKEYDRSAVKKFPVILAKASREIYRLPDQESRLQRMKELLGL